MEGRMDARDGMEVRNGWMGWTKPMSVSHGERVDSSVNDLSFFKHSCCRFRKLNYKLT